MFGDTYKMDINDIKEKVRQNYMHIAYNFVMSKEYSKKCKVRLHKLLLENLILIFIDFLLYKRGLPCIDEVSGIYFIFAIILSVGIVLYIFFGLYYQNILCMYDIKKRYIKDILHNFEDTKYSNDYESKNMSDEITYDDVQEFNFTKDYSPKEFMPIAINEIFTGYYKNIPYSLQKMYVHKISIKAGIYKDKNKGISNGMGLILKANTNFNIDGWVSVCTKECIKKSWTFTNYFIMYFMVCTYCLLGLYPFIKMVTNFLYTYGILFTLIVIISCFIAKYETKGAMIFATNEKKKEKFADIPYINEKVSIKASDNIKDINNIVTVEFVDMLEQLKILFKNPKIYCKFSHGDMILAIHSYKNMFDMGGLFVPPTNTKVAEKFVSQMSGILLFLDYIANLNNNSSS